ncbi:MAG TPA: hypothetical protein VIK11_06285 [Tepidiformaceae bacterium]|jgi:hypothetical protein
MWDDDDLEPFVEAESLPRDKIVAVARAFRAADIPFAFGGAISLEFFGTPRGSWDIDANLFVPEDRAWDVLQSLVGLIEGIHLGRALAVIERDGQLRIDWDGTEIDLYFSYDPFHESCRTRVRQVTFDGEPIGVLSAEDLVVLKVLADRDRDWVDVEDIMDSQGATFDLAYTRRWIELLCGGSKAKPRRFEALIGNR